MNNLQDGDIKVGDRLVVSNEKTTMASAQQTEVENEYHVVRPKETLYAIAKKYNASINDLKAWNNINQNELSVGSTLIVGKEYPGGNRTIITKQTTGKRILPNIRNMLSMSYVMSIRIKNYGTSR
ncbi:MAG: LysM peptidoglycan-binding domain-containing protein [Bacteroidales bacterium]|nr:LysM peptidoglycan-binding domain-containing protein [Bacteroidales bacterium]